jgi:hypothetical protein
MRISLNAAIGIDGPQTVNQVIEEIAGARQIGSPAEQSRTTAFLASLAQAA